MRSARDQEGRTVRLAIGDRVRDPRHGLGRVSKLRPTGYAVVIFDGGSTLLVEPERLVVIAERAN